MKKALIAVVAMMFLVSFATLSFARAGKSLKHKTTVIRGTIVSIDTTNNQIVLKQSKTGVEKTISAEANTIASLKVGETIKVVLKGKSNKAESITVLKKKKSKK
jgi:hypothetical protein